MGRNHKIHFMAKEEIFKIPVFGEILKRLGAFPVKRGTADRRAIVYALDLLKTGSSVGLFPEGTRSRSGELLKAHDGAALIVLRSGMPVLPIAIRGQYKIFQPLSVMIGQPIIFQKDGKNNNSGHEELHPRKDKKDEKRNVTKVIMAEIHKLHEELKKSE